MKINTFLLKKKNTSLESTHRRNLPQYNKGHIQASLMAQMLKNLPAMQETRVQSLGWEDPLEKDMVTHSSILA